MRCYETERTIKEELHVNINAVDSPLHQIKRQFIYININNIENKILCKKRKNEVTPDEDDIVMCE